MPSDALSIAGSLRKGIRREWMLLATLAACVIFALGGVSLFARMARPGWLTFVFAWLFAAVLGSALSVVATPTSWPSGWASRWARCCSRCPSPRSR